MNQLARTPVQIGSALRRTRIAAGLTQQELAAKVGIRQATVSRIELGQPSTRIDTICSILAVLDLEFTVASRSKGAAQDIEDLF